MKTVQLIINNSSDDNGHTLSVYDTKTGESLLYVVLQKFQHAKRAAGDLCRLLGRNRFQMKTGDKIETIDVREQA